jgi:hypothetical protein
MLSNPASSSRPGVDGDGLVFSPFPIWNAAASSFNSIGIAGIRSPESSARNAAETSATQEPRTSAVPASQPQRIESLLGIPSPLTRSGRNGALTGYRMSMTMFSSTISEAGKSIVETDGKRWAASIGTFMLLLFGQVCKLWYSYPGLL